MCLIALAHRASERYPLVIAANRDEDHERATRPAHVWDDAPDIIGGRDLLHGGSWLAVTRAGRFAAVTNLRGAVQRGLSRGHLVTSFVISDLTPEAFAALVARDAAAYAGFHLIAGQAGGTVVYVAGGDEPVMPQVLDRGIYAFSNAPSGEHWPKVDAAMEQLKRWLSCHPDAERREVASPSQRGRSFAVGACPERSRRAAQDDTTDLLQFLRAPRNGGRIEEEVFIVGDRYGTRASTVVVATTDEMLFAEQNYARGGIAFGEPSIIRWPRS